LAINELTSIILAQSAGNALTRTADRCCEVLNISKTAGMRIFQCRYQSCRRLISTTVRLTRLWAGDKDYFETV